MVLLANKPKDRRNLVEGNYSYVWGGGGAVKKPEYVS